MRLSSDDIQCCVVGHSMTSLESMWWCGESGSPIRCH